jgi:hypothetical protein
MLKMRFGAVPDTDVKMPFVARFPQFGEPVVRVHWSHQKGAIAYVAAETGKHEARKLLLTVPKVRWPFEPAETVV